jgi:hypothetical protein
VLNTLRLKQASGLISVDDLGKINSWLSQHTIILEDQNPIDVNAPLEDSEALPERAEDGFEEFEELPETTDEILEDFEDDLSPS